MENNTNDEVATPAPDVENVDLFNSYSEKRHEWLQWINHDEEHPISGQITILLWRDQIFWWINEARRISVESKFLGSSRNPVLQTFIDTAYASIQLVGIRRLLEPSSEDPARQILSLRRLVDDVVRNKELFTRENYLAGVNALYEYEAEYTEFIRRSVLENSDPAQERPDASPWILSERLHKKFDQLSQVDVGNRRRDDGIAIKVFEFLASTIRSDKFDLVKDRVNKFIAHAADEFSRSSVGSDQSELTFQTITECEKILVSLTNFISGTLLWQGQSRFIPTYQGNPVELLEQSWVPATEIDRLNDFWHAHQTEVKAWPGYNVNDILGNTSADIA